MAEVFGRTGRDVLFVSVLVVTVTLWAATGTAAAQSAPDCSTVTYNGDGTETNPYEVGNVDQLQCINEQDPGADYRQVSDINASGTSGWNDGKGFEPIGEFNRTRDTEFTGNFDGTDHTISELTIDRGSANRVGLFGQAEADSRLENVSLENVDITGDGAVGGLVGFSYGTVTDSYVTGGISGDGGVGGLVGVSFGAVTESYAVGNVSGNNSYVGGLIGNNNLGGTVENSYATVDTTGKNLVGGLVGSTVGIVRESYVNGSVSGNDDVGGLGGVNGGVVKRSYATGNVSGNRNVGGLVGDNRVNVTESYATGDVSGDDKVGGLVGVNGNDGIIERSYATGNVSGNDDVGGLVGFSYGTVNESYWDTESTGQSTSAGGTGLNKSEITGDAAARNMQGFNFMTTWETVSGEYPTLDRQSDGGEDGSSDSTGSNNDGESDSSDGTEGEDMPGFTVVTAVLALFTVAAAAVRQREE
jgi:PGF-CTERM protein